ncbi:MAG TPA: hypothetical protein VFR86_12275 [Burkholderiaceae bacterium]|nr:hypothetical protein [Burkholderiaceae bacterium]
MAELTISVYALPPHTAAALRSTLSLLDTVLGKRWRVLDAPMADVIAVASERIATIGKTAGEEDLPLLLALGNDDACPPGAFALVRLPATPARLIEALQLAEGLVERARAGDEGVLTVPLLESLDVEGRIAPASFDTRVRTSLRAATWRLLQQPVAVTILDDRRESVYSFLPARGYTTRLTIAELANRFRANSPAVFVELSKPETVALSKAREFRSRKELEWVFWISNGAPRLRPDLDPERRWRLDRWPDFGHLPHYQADVRMATALKAQALTLGRLCEAANVRMETAINFLNATFTFGILAADPETALKVPAAPPPTLRRRAP